MTRTGQILVCVVLVGVVRGPAVCDDSWTSALGQFTRALAEQKRTEAALQKEFPTHHLAFDLSLEDPYYMVQDEHRLPHVYLDKRRFFYRKGNRQIDYRDLAGLADDRVIPWTPFAYGYHGYGRDRGGYYDGDGRGRDHDDGRGGGDHQDGRDGRGRLGGYYGYGGWYQGYRQEVPLEMRDNWPSGTSFGRIIRVPRGHSR